MADGVAVRVRWLREIEGTAGHVALIGACLQRLELLRLSRQVDVLGSVLEQVTARTGRAVVAR